MPLFIHDFGLKCKNGFKTELEGEKILSLLISEGYSATAVSQHLLHRK